MLQLLLLPTPFDRAQPDAQSATDRPFGFELNGRVLAQLPQTFCSLIF